MEELEKIVQAMMDAGETEESIASVVQEWKLQNPVPETPLNPDQGVDGKSGKNSILPSSGGELVYGDQRNLDTQIEDYNRLKKELLDAKGQYDNEFFKNKTPEERKEYLKFIPEPGYVASIQGEEKPLNFTQEKIIEKKDLFGEVYDEQKITTGQDQEITQIAKNDLDYDIDRSQLSWTLLDDKSIDELPLEKQYVEKSNYLYNDLITNNKYLNKFLYPKIISEVDEFIEAGPLKEIQKKYGLLDGEWTPDEYKDYQFELNELRMSQIELVAKNSPQFEATLNGISELVSKTVGEEMQVKATKQGRENMEFRLPFSSGETSTLLGRKYKQLGDILAYKGTSDMRLVKGLQQFSKTTTQAAYGLELMVDGARGKVITEEINNINTRINNGDIGIDDTVDYDIVKSQKQNTVLSKKTGTAEEALDYLNGELFKNIKEQAETLGDIKNINEDLSLFTKSELYDEDGVTFGDVAQLLGSQVPQLALAYFSGGLGITLQEIGSTYTSNLNLIARKKFNIPDGIEPTIEQLTEIINSKDDEITNALTTGVVVGQLERFSAGKILGTGKAGKRVIASLLRQEGRLALQAAGKTGKRIGEQGLTEYITEGLQTGVSQISGSIVSEENQFDYSQIKEAAGVGGLIGSIIPTSVSLVKQTATEFKTAAMKIASAESNLGQLEKIFQAMENKINNDSRFNQKTKRERILALGQIRNKLSSLPKDYSPNQKQKALELIIKKEQIEKQYEDVDQSLIPKPISDEIKNIEKKLQNISTEAFIVKTVDMAQKDGLGENVFTAKTTEEADKLAAEKGITFVTKNGKRAEGAFSADGKTIIIDLEQAKKVGAVNVAGHEILHRVLFNTLYEMKDGKIVGTDISRSLELELDKELDKIDPKLLKNEYLIKRLANYKDKGKSMQAEEKLTILSDALRLGQINLDGNAVDRLKTYFRRILQNAGFKKIKFNEGKDVINFIKDYNASLDKGSFSKSLLKGAKDKEGFEVSDNIKGKLKDDYRVVDQAESISEIEPEVLSEADKKVQDIYEEKGIEGANEIIEGSVVGNNIKKITRKYENRPTKLGKNMDTQDRQLFQDDIKLGVLEVIQKYPDYVTNFKPTPAKKNPASLTAFINKSFGTGPKSFKKYINIANKVFGEDFFDDMDTASGIISEDTAEDTVIASENTSKKLTKATKILNESQYEKAKNLLGNFLKGKDKNKLNFKNLKNATTEVLSDITGIPVNKIQGNSSVNLSKSEVTKGAMFIENNIDDIRRTMPKGAITEGADQNLVGTSTGVAKTLLQNPNLYKKAPRISNTSTGLFPFVKNRNISNEDILEAIGRPIGKPSKPIDPRSSEASAIKGILSIVDKNISNEIARVEYDLTPQQEVNIAAGKSDQAYSISEGTENLINNPNFDLEVNGAAGLLKNFKDDEGNPLQIDNLTTITGIDNYMIGLQKYVFPLAEFSFFFGKTGSVFVPSDRIAFPNKTSIKNKLTGKVNKKGEITVKKETDPKKIKDLKKRLAEGIAIAAYYKTQINNLRSSKNFGAKIGDGDYSRPTYKSVFGSTASEIDKSNKNGTIAKFNKKHGEIHRVIWERINDEIVKNKKAAVPIAGFLKLVAQDTRHFHRLGAEMTSWSENPKGNGTKLFEWEHAMPATSAYLYLLDVSLRKDNFKAAYKGVMNNYKLIALDAAMDKKLKAAGLQTRMPKGWLLGENYWWQRYFNDDVAAINGGIPPSSLMMTEEFGNRTMADELQINEKGEYTPSNLQKSITKASISNNNSLPLSLKLSPDFNNEMVLDKMATIDKENLEANQKFSISEDLSETFNEIIENKTNIGKNKTYASVKAKVAGADKGKFKMFVPPSAEDFVGLLYATLGRGKIGDAQMQWYKTNLINPYARAMDNLNKDRLSVINSFKTLKKDLKIVPKNLNKKIPGEPFTQSQAIRVYIWNKQGMTVPGLSRADLKVLTEFVEEDLDMVAFADQLIAINKGDQYSGPKEFWISGTISTDLLDGLNTIKRARYLELWQQNADTIFSEANLNKLEAAFGEKYKDALINILQRMKTGRNRTFGTDTLTGRVTDWLTNSVGAIMFFNTRSAILQTISSINFINFTDNNPLKAGLALLNAPQYGKDFMKLMNSPFLLARRDGLRLNVSESDIADMAKAPGSMAKRFIAETLRLGFLPTQIADSFAIASGGATFYRNRIKSLVKSGMEVEVAEKQAMLDFIELAEESQQSSRPDRISAQQAGPLGRVILAFANTPMQYTRLIKKAGSDLINGRGDAKTNISKIIYYGLAQNLLFNALQQALFALAFEDEEEEDNKKEKRAFDIINSMSDQFLRGSGVAGAIASTLKNTVIKLIKQNEKKNPKYAQTLIEELTQVSPPIGSKIRKLSSAGKSFEWNKKEMMEKGWSLDNPAYLAVANIVSAATNVPLDRAIKKIDNLKNASNTDLETWKRIASFGGWSKWQLNIEKAKEKKKIIWRTVKKSKRKLK